MPVLEIKHYLGIDPGQSGAIALLDRKGAIVFLEKMPRTEACIWDMISEYCGSANKAFIEKVHAMPKQGVSSTFKFGCGYGGLRMALVAADIPFDEITPQAWQKALGVVPRKVKTESKRDHKNKLLAKAQQLYPGLGKRLTLQLADALLIAHYCYRREMGLL